MEFKEENNFHSLKDNPRSSYELFLYLEKISIVNLIVIDVYSP